MYYDTDTLSMAVYKGSTWVPVFPGPCPVPQHLCDNRPCMLALMCTINASDDHLPYFLVTALGILSPPVLLPAICLPNATRIFRYHPRPRTPHFVPPPSSYLCNPVPQVLGSFLPEPRRPRARHKRDLLRHHFAIVHVTYLHQQTHCIPFVIHSQPCPCPRQDFLIPPLISFSPPEPHTCLVCFRFLTVWAHI